MQITIWNFQSWPLFPHSGKPLYYICHDSLGLGLHMDDILQGFEFALVSAWPRADCHSLKTLDIQFNLWFMICLNQYNAVWYIIHYWPFVRGIHRSPVDSPHKGQCHGALMFSFICTWTNGWANNPDIGDLRQHHAHYHFIVIHSSTWLYLVYLDVCLAYSILYEEGFFLQCELRLLNETSKVQHEKYDVTYM